ncbi:MAG TPA: amidohydrolase family protein [Actinomycetota bacterium]
MSDPLVIRGARLIDGRGSDPVDDAVLVAQGGRVMYAGPVEDARGFEEHPSAIDADGRTLMPGLIDAHVHLCFDGAPDFAADADAMSEADALERCREAAARALHAGITTVRDLGGLGEATLLAAREQRRGNLKGARILTAGQVLTVTGGHAHFIGREVDSSDDLTKAIDDLKEAGADVVKVIATGGVLTPGIGALQPAFTREQLEAAVNEAHRLGMRIAAHAIGAEGIAAAAAAGVDSIEHGCYLEGGAISAMISTPSWLVPTLSAPDRISHGGRDVPDYARVKSDKLIEHHRAAFAAAVEAGVRTASGTDAGTPYNPHGGLAYELRLMHEAGMSLRQVLAATTREAAQLLGLGEAGTIEPEQIADVILLDGDPLEDAGAYERVVMVVYGGHVVVDRR